MYSVLLLLLSSGCRSEGGIYYLLDVEKDASLRTLRVPIVIRRDTTSRLRNTDDPEPKSASKILTVHL